MIILRKFFIWLDQVAFGFIDDAYNLILGFATGDFITTDDVMGIIRNMYVIVGIVALFRIALLLINALIDPEKLFEKGKGLGNILVRTVLMLVILVISPFLFKEVFELQNHIMKSNVIPKLIVGSETNSVTGENAGKQIKNIALSTLIPVNHKFVLKVDSVTGEPLSDSEQANPGDKKFIYLYEMTYDSQGNAQKIYDDDGKIITNPDFNEENSTDKTGGYLFNEATCTTDNCKRAVNKYNKLYMSGDMDVSELKKYINTSVKIPVDSNGDETTESNASSYETEYVYNYMILLTTVTGVFITYILFSFALDIAIRVFELATLQILSPLFIVTFVDPKSASSGPFNKWLKAFGNSYAGLFIRIAAVCLLIFLISWINNYDILDNSYLADQSGLAKLLLIWGVLAFAKKAPKWIGDMIGIQSDGLGNLGIGKKLTAGALGGALLAKGAKGLAGASLATGMNLMNQQRHRRKQLKAAKKENPHLFGDTDEGRAYRAERNKENYRNIRAKNKGMSAATALAQARRQTEKDIKDEMKKAGLNAGTGAAQIASAVINGAGAFSTSAKADKLSGALKASSDRSKDFKDQKGLQGDSVFDKIKTGVTRQGARLTDAAWGDEGERYKRADKINKEKTMKRYHNKEFVDKYGLSGKLIDGMGKFAGSIVDDNGNIARNIEDAKAIYAAKVTNPTASIKYENGKLTIDGNTNVQGYVDQAQQMLSGSGKVHFLDMFNKTQGNSLNEYQSNNQAIDSISNTISSFNSAIDANMRKIANSMSSITSNTKLSFDAPTGALEVKLSSTGDPIKIDTSNFDSLVDTMKTIPGFEEDASYLETHRDSIFATLNDRDNIIKQNEVYENTIISEQTRLQPLRDRNNELQGLIDDINLKVENESGLLKRKADGTVEIDTSAATIAGAQAAIARNADSIAKIVAVADEKDKKEEKA